VSTGRQEEADPLTDRGKLLLIAKGIAEAGPAGRHGGWIELPRTWSTIVVAQLRAIAGRMGDGCDINPHIGTVPQGEPQTFRATRTGYDDKTGTYTFTIAEGEATDENEPA